MITLQCDRCGYKVKIMPDCGDTIPFRYSDYKFYYTELPRKKEVFLCEECNKELPRIILECDDAVKNTWDKKMNEWLNQYRKDDMCNNCIHILDLNEMCQACKNNKRKESDET